MSDTLRGVIIIFKYRFKNEPWKTQIPLGNHNLGYKLIHPFIYLLIRKKDYLAKKKSNSINIGLFL